MGAFAQERRRLRPERGTDLAWIMAGRGGLVQSRLGDRDLSRTLALGKVMRSGWGHLTEGDEAELRDVEVRERRRVR